jgi:hypothetical protein
MESASPTGDDATHPPICGLQVFDILAVDRMLIGRTEGFVEVGAGKMVKLRTTLVSIFEHFEDLKDGQVGRLGGGFAGLSFVGPIRLHLPSRS